VHDELQAGSWRPQTICTPAIARDAARLRAHHSISLADGFAMATARAHQTSLATFDKRVRRALRSTGVDLIPELR
jgi:predicted nucleic acid-binding protein